MITLTVNLIGFCLVGLIIWWFILKKPKSTQLINNTIQVVVDEGVYEPSILKAREGKMITLEFIRKDIKPLGGLFKSSFKMDSRTKSLNDFLPVNSFIYYR